MLRRPPRSTRTDTLFPYTTLFRSFETTMLIMGSMQICSRKATQLAGKQEFNQPDAAPTQIATNQEKSATRCGEHAFARFRSEEHTSELQSLMRISYAVFCLKKKNI